MKKRLLFVQLDASGQTEEGDWQELLCYLAANGMDKIVLAGTPSGMVRATMQEFDQDGSLVKIIERPDALAAILQRGDYEVTNLSENYREY